MPFTESQKDKIRTYLGYPAAFRDQNHRLESMMTTVGANATEQASVEALLTEIAAVDTALAAGATSSQTRGSLKKLDEVEFYEATGNSSLDVMSAVSRGKVLIERLRQRFGVPLQGFYFSAGRQISEPLALG